MLHTICCHARNLSNAQDRIVVTWLKDKPKDRSDLKDFQIISPPDQMGKYKMIRGTGEKIFFVESNNLSDKIMQLGFNENKNFKI